MPSRRDWKERNNPRERTNQGECDPDSEQQHSETDLSSGTPQTRRGIADHPNRRYIVIDPDPSYTPHPGPGGDRIIRPSQVNAVVGASPDRVDEVIEQVRDLNEPPREGALGSGHHCESVNHTTLASGTRPVSDQSRSQDNHSKSANARPGLADRESGMSLDGFPSRSLEEGGVSGLYQRENGRAGGGTVSDSAGSSTSSSHASATGSCLTADGATFHTARAVTIRPAPADYYPFDDEDAVHRMLLPAELDRMDELINDALMFFGDTGVVAPIQASDEGEDEMLTGDRENFITVSDRNPALWSEGELGPPYSHYAQDRATPRMDNADGHPTHVENAQLRRSSLTPSESSITETVFNVRRPTPPPQPPGITSLPSSQRHAVTAAEPSGGLQRGGAYPSADAEQEEAVPAVLVPGGGRGWLGLYGSHRPLQVSRRQGKDGPDVEKEKERRRREKREE